VNNGAGRVGGYGGGTVEVESLAFPGQLSGGSWGNGVVDAIRGCSRCGEFQRRLDS